MGKTGFAVIGCGRMGRRRAKTVREHPDAELICVSDVEEKVSRKLAEEQKCDYYDDFEKAIMRKEVDCVIVCVPNKYHLLVARRVLEEGKHVFCEKPLARTPEEAIALVEAASKNGVFLKTGSNLRYFPSVQKARELLDQKALGELLFLRGWIGNSGDHLKNSWFREPELSGGGTFLDNGCHLLDLTRWFLGEVVECKGSVATMYWDIEPLEDNGFGIFETFNHQSAFVQSSWTEWADYMYMEIYGVKGYLWIENRNTLCRTMLGDRKRSRQLFDYSLLPPSSYDVEFREYMAALQRGEQPLPSGFDGLRAVQMVHGVYESSKKGTSVKIWGEREEKLAKS